MAPIKFTFPEKIVLKKSDSSISDKLKSAFLNAVPKKCALNNFELLKFASLKLDSEKLTFSLKDVLEKFVGPLNSTPKKSAPLKLLFEKFAFCSFEPEKSAYWKLHSEKSGSLKMDFVKYTGFEKFF